MSIIQLILFLLMYFLEDRLLVWTLPALLWMNYIEVFNISEDIEDIDLILFFIFFNILSSLFTTTTQSNKKEIDFYIFLYSIIF